MEENGESCTNQNFTAILLTKDIGLLVNNYAQNLE